MKAKNEYIDSLATELKEWSVQSDLFAAKTEKAAGMIKLKYTEQLKAFRAKQLEAAERMRELEESSGEAWEIAKDTADKVWNELRTGLNTAASKF